MIKKGMVLGTYLLIATIILALDRWSKVAVEHALSLGNSIQVWSIFHITLVHNYGGAFGILQNKRILFEIVGIGVVIGILVYLYVARNLSWWMVAGLACVSAGALGNLYDRTTLGYVIDFIDVRVWDYVFNVADVFIDVGFGAILVDIFLSSKKETDGKTS